MAGDTERVQDYELTTSASLVDIGAGNSPLPQVRPDSVQRTSDAREEGWDDETLMYANAQGEPTVKKKSGCGSLGSCQW